MQQYRAHRYPAGASVEVQSGSRRGVAKILDINQNGARLVGSTTFGRGDKITVVVGMNRLEAIVRWAATDRYGVAFVAALSSQALTKIKGKGNQGRMSLYG